MRALLQLDLVYEGVMANKITGRAKKHDGTAIDYVTIFNWIDGKCIAQVPPDASGVWHYNYSKDLEVGITYVADGCEPITHGPYDFLYKYDPLLDPIVHYSFNGDFLDQSSNALDGIKTGDANFVAGRKRGTQALEFVAGCVRTPIALPINSDKTTISFWIKVVSSDVGVIYEFSSDYNNESRAPALFINNLGQGFIDSAIRAHPLRDDYNIVKSPVSMGSDWQHIIVDIDLSRAGSQEQRIYTNNVLTSEYIAPYDYDDIGNISNYVMYIGQRNASSTPFKGVMQDMRVYNRLLTEVERTALFNE